MSKLKDWLFAYPPEIREALVQQHADTSLGYLYKRVYSTEPGEDPTFKAKIAIGLDKASRGTLDFRTMIEDGSAIDWRYVRSRLNALAREGRLTEPERIE